MLKKEQDFDISSEGSFSQSVFQTYMYLVKAAKPVGPRDVMRGANLSSPSVAYRNLQKLIDTGVVRKDEYGNYLVKEKVHFSGYLWIGKRLVPRFIIFCFIFVGALIAEIAVLIPHLLVRASVEESFWLLTAVTVVSAVIFVFEGLRFRRKKMNQFPQFAD